MVNSGSTFSWNDTSGVGLESSLVGLNSNGNNLFVQSSIELSNVVSDDISLVGDTWIGECSRVYGCVIHVGRASSSDFGGSGSVGISSIGSDTVFGCVVPCIEVPSTVASLVSVSSRAVDQFLFRELGVDFVGTLSPDEAQVFSSGERPAWSALTLVQNGWVSGGADPGLVSGNSSGSWFVEFNNVSLFHWKVECCQIFAFELGLAQVRE